jgi:predicted membrane-bound mannosyltransferase
VPEVSAAGEAAYNAVTLPRPSARPRLRSRPGSAPPTVSRESVEAPASRSAVAAVRGVSVETALYGLFLVLAVLTRFWNLGAKALHHDESLHAYFSWIYETGGGYRHDPLMHGPFLFHIEALVFLLFGDSDASSRYAPAFFGVIMVGLPYLLRGPRYLGRWGALAASFLLLISPAILYQSRYIRHDIFTIVPTLLLFICIVRYLEVPERRWLIASGVSAGILITNHEIVFAIFAIWALYLYGALVWGRAHAWWSDRRDAARRLIAVHAGAIVGTLAVYLLVPQRYKDELLDIPWENPTKQQQLDYYQKVATNPITICMVLIAIGFVVSLWYVLSDARAPERREEGWLPSLLGDPPAGTVEFGIRRIWDDRTGLALGLSITAVIFVALFTSLFTNLDGLVTSTVATNGTLLYWLGQHDVRRGEQPWFYFLLLMPQYEFIAVIFGTALAGLTCWRALGAALGRWSGGRNLFFRLFLTVWLAGIFVGLSIAGEKMPWLVVHISLPATLLAAALIGGLIERAIAAVRVRRADPVRSLIFWPEWGLLAALLLAGGCWLALAGRLTVGQFVADDAYNRGGWRRTLTSYDARHWWLLAVPPAVALVLLAAGYLWRGPRRTGLTALAALTIGLALLQIHTAWRMNYYEADVPKDMLIYTQTSPDVTRLMDEIDQLSEEMTGGKGLKIWYDSGVSWPMQWYLRDYPNKEFKGTAISSIPDDVPIVLVSNDYERGFKDALSGYTAQEYVLRWWFPEETYRDFAIAPELSPGRSAWKSSSAPHGPLDIVKSIGDTLGHQLTPEGQLRLYRLMMYRDLDWPNGQYNFKLYIRNDLLPFFNGIRYG